MHPRTTRLSTLILVTPCLLLSQCSHSPSYPRTPVSQKKMEWQVIGHNPLTYAPKGVKPPETVSASSSVPEYVYLADRRTRFYIPPLAVEYRQRALAARAESLKLGPEVMPPRLIPKPERVKKRFSAKEAALLVIRIPATALIVCLAINPYGYPPDMSGALDEIWGR